jgi:hypothetical protein
MNEQYEPYWSNYLKQFKDLSDEHTCFQNIPSYEKTNKFCVIIEPRKHPLLESVLKNFMALLSQKNWGLIIFHGTENEEFVSNIISKWKTVYSIKLNYDNLSTRMYNQLLCSNDFWNIFKTIGAEHVLIFQTDVLLLRPDIDDFIEYDYVGAPWNPETISFCRNNEFPGGNGGFSLRNVDAMIDCIHQIPFQHIMNEDVYFSLICHHLHKKLPPMSISSQFSVESFYYENPCGLHKPHLSNIPEGQYPKLLDKTHIFS